MRIILVFLIFGIFILSCATTKETKERENYLQYLNDNIVAVSDSVFAFNFKFKMSDTILLKQSNRQKEYLQFESMVRIDSIENLSIRIEDLSKVMKVKPDIQDYPKKSKRFVYRMNIGSDCAGEYDFIDDSCVELIYMADSTGYVYFIALSGVAVDVELKSYVKEYFRVKEMENRFSIDTLK